MFEIVAGELRAKLGTVSAMRQVRSGRDTCAVAGPGWTTSRHTRPHISTPRPTGVEGAGGICRGAGGRRQGLAGLRADAPSEARGADGERAGRPRGGRRSVGATSNNSQRGRRAGGPPPTGTHSGRGLRHPEHPWGHKQPSNANARQPERAAARSRSQWNTQRSRAATTSATWTAFRAAPLRRLSPETTRTRPRLPSTAWS